MLNQTILVGRITKEVEFKELESGKKQAIVNIAIPRSYKNENGEYDTDFINIILWEAIATNVIEYCKKGDLIGIKGRLQTVNDTLQVVAEKVTFLSSKKESEEQ